MIKDVYGQGLRLYKCIDSYVEVQKPKKWLNCPNCGCKPLVWIFNNGSNTACCCGENEYNHFSIKSESIASRYSRESTVAERSKSSEDLLMENWNIWCNTGKDSFKIKKAKLAEENINIW